MAHRRRHWPRVLAGVASTMVLLVTGAAAAGAALYDRLDSNISSVNVDDQLAPRKATTPTPTEPMNILVMGSDTRKGEGNDKKYGNARNAGIEGARSDTTMLVHLSADRDRALAVSIPRDSLVTLPVCKTPKGERLGGYLGRFNEAFDIGGPGCTLKAVEELTGLYVDHFVVVDFNGFKQMVEAVGGVDVCLEEAVDDVHSGLKLPAGRSTVTGEQALAFVRARESLGDGSDIQRIQRQQEFISSVIRKLASAEVLANPVKMYRLLDAGTAALTTDPQLASLDAFREIAETLRDMRPEDVTFATVPHFYNADGATVSWDEQKSKAMFDALANDQPWPTPATTPDGQDPLTVAPSDIDVVVVNGTDAPGYASMVAQDLSDEGYNVVATRSSRKNTTTTTLRYDPNHAEAARTLGYAAGATDTEIRSGQGPRMVLTVGSDYGGVQSVIVKRKKPDKFDTAAPKTADTSVCVS